MVDAKSTSPGFHMPIWGWILAAGLLLAGILEVVHVPGLAGGARFALSMFVLVRDGG